MMDKQQIINGVIACAIFALILLVLRAVKNILPKLWELAKPWLGKRARMYQQFIDDLTNNKDAQLRLAVELLDGTINWTGLALALLISTVFLGLVQSPETADDVFYAAVFLFWFTVTLNIIYLMFSGIPYLLKRFALEMAKKQERKLQKQSLEAHVKSQEVE